MTPRRWSQRRGHISANLDLTDHLSARKSPEHWASTCRMALALPLCVPVIPAFREAAKPGMQFSASEIHRTGTKTNRHSQFGLVCVTRPDSNTEEGKSAEQTRPM